MKLNLRKVEVEDCQFLFECARDDDPKTSSGQHNIWMREVLHGGKHGVLIVRRSGGKKVAVVKKGALKVHPEFHKQVKEIEKDFKAKKAEDDRTDSLDN